MKQIRSRQRTCRFLNIKRRYVYPFVLSTKNCLQQGGDKGLLFTDICHPPLVKDMFICAKMLTRDEGAQFCYNYNMHQKFTAMIILWHVPAIPESWGKFELCTMTFCSIKCMQLQGNRPFAGYFVYFVTAWKPDVASYSANKLIKQNRLQKKLKTPLLLLNLFPDPAEYFPNITKHVTRYQTLWDFSKVQSINEIKTRLFRASCEGSHKRYIESHCKSVDQACTNCFFFNLLQVARKILLCDINFNSKTTFRKTLFSTFVSFLLYTSEPYRISPTICFQSRFKVVISRWKLALRLSV